ncbi:MAG TPA: hypothetical protein PLU37_09400 [Chitinophagaceae bacterium]|nr:hypothetical protein [Chitinophagaceae bacterium]HPG11733.1 hypothetical protein [Chitinophagaceae bacterium]HRX94184.1 hypothetical protein [Chitinophagaceae bacterium]
MKKFLLVLAIAGFAVACNNSGKSDTPAEDSTTVTEPTTPTEDSATMAPADSTTMAPATEDSTAK